MGNGWVDKTNMYIDSTMIQILVLGLGAANVIKTDVQKRGRHRNQGPRIDPLWEIMFFFSWNGKAALGNRD